MLRKVFACSSVLLFVINIGIIMWIYSQINEKKYFLLTKIILSLYKIRKYFIWTKNVSLFLLTTERKHIDAKNFTLTVFAMFKTAVVIRSQHLYYGIIIKKRKNTFFWKKKMLSWKIKDHDLFKLFA